MTNPDLEVEPDNSLASTSNDLPKEESNYVDIDKLDVDPNPTKKTIEIQPTNQTRFALISNRFFQKKTRRLKFFELYKYADKYDIILMIIGTLAAILTGVCATFALDLYQVVTNNLVELGKLHTNTTVSNFNNTLSNNCSILRKPILYISPYDTIQRIIRYYVLIGFLTIFFYWVAWITWIIAAERQVRRIRFALFRNILRQEIGWFDIHSAGELNNQLVNNLDKIYNGINDKMPDFISLLARMVGPIIYALILGWKLTLVFLSVSPFIVLSFNLTVKIIVKYTIKEIKAFGLASSIAQEVLQNIRTVTAFHGQQKEEERFTNNLIETKNIGIRKGIYMGICQSITQLLYFIAFTAVFCYGPHLVRTECLNYSPGAVLVIFVACFNATLNTALLVPTFENFAEALGSGSGVFDMIERQTKIDASNDEGDKPDTITGHIEFRNVTFTYPARQDASILNKLSLEIPSGQTVALVGSSGCGKSTIIQLIQRFYDPDDGQIFLDGKEIKKLNVAWLRSHIGIVSQEPVLFTGSIEDNIRFGKPDATDEEVQNAAKTANAHDFIMALPKKYKTTSGDKLSGGQKQRVAIARALISNPKILLLDEATSALDNTSERVIQDALDKAKQGRTTIVVAHRLSTIRSADLIIGLERGEVIENGNHDELMERKGLYYDLVTTQTEKEKEDADNDDEDDDEIEREFVRQNSVNPSFTNQVSHISSDGDPNVDIIDYEEYDDPSVKKKFFRKPFLFKILKFNAPEWRWILLGAICSLINGATQPVFSLLFTIIYGLFAEPDLEKQKHLTNVYAGIIFTIGFVASITQFLSSVGFAKSGEALTMRMRKLTFSAMLRQEMAYFDQEMNSVGALATRLSSDASSLKGLTGARIGFILQAVSAIVTALALAFSSGWKLTLVVLCFAPFLMLNGILYGQTQGKAGQSKAKDSFTEQGGQHATQAIEHIRTVVALRQEKHFINLYEYAFNQEFKKQMCRMHLTALGAGLANSIACFLHCANFAYGSKLVASGEMKYDRVVRVFAVITFSMISIGRSMAMLSDYSKGKAAALRIMKLHNRQSKINSNDESGIILKNPTLNIEFRDVSFRYPGRPTVRILRNFSLKCATSQTTALVGPSGSGKSTTIALLQRFYDPIKGKILLDGNDIKVLNLKWLRSIMGLVQQEPILFNLSIRDNIAYGDTSRVIPQHEVEDAARRANIHELIITLPQGYETLCGAKGSQLSGGQKQRIAIARALIRNPKILLLDEATSALDNKSEKVVQTTLNEAQIGRTCLTIAHRLSTIKNAQNIAVVNRGKMTEEGTHDQLLKQNGIYAKLASAQQRSCKS